MTARRLLAGLALAMLVGTMPLVAQAPVAAARPNLTLVGDTTYDVLPEQQRVAVTVRLTATNHLRDTPTRRFFFRTTVLTVQPGTTNFRLTGGNGAPKVSVRARTDTYTNVRLDFGANLAAGRSTQLTLTYDIPDEGGPPDRPVRISDSLITFTAWAFATPETPGATVAVRLPRGYTTTIGRGPLQGPQSDASGHDVWTSGNLTAALSFIADVAADKPAEYEETSREVALSDGPATVLIRAWPDDPDWRDRVGALVEEALPILEQDIGVPWPIEGDLAVHEALVRGTTGFAGVFDPARGTIEVAYAAPDVVVLHELAHAWFNGRLVADRWTAEAFASYYAELAAAELGLEPALPAPGEPEPDPIALNDWGPSGTEDPAAEAAAYTASLALAEAIAERAGPDGLREVWRRAAAREAAYQREPTVEGVEPERSETAPDWRSLLDLLEESTDASYADLWRASVARPQDLELIAAREVTRGTYQRSVENAGTWRLPLEIREAMRAWRFDIAADLLAQADAVIDQRDRLEASAAAVGVRLPTTLRQVFEGDAGMQAAADEATAELATVEAIASAEAARPRSAGLADQLVVDIGLLLTNPEGQLEAAKIGLESGELEAAYRTASDAESTWANAAGVGRSRVVSVGLLLLALLVLISLLRQRRRTHAAPGPALAAATLPGDPAAAPAPTGASTPEVEGGHATGDAPRDP